MIDRSCSFSEVLLKMIFYKSHNSLLNGKTMGISNQSGKSKILKPPACFGLRNPKLVSINEEYETSDDAIFSFINNTHNTENHLQSHTRTYCHENIYF
jgi:hypothetical protein